ncbi:MAG TPA: S41 family peptidase, partial [Bacteroidia bacterium]|nr:S41 family peptidase [Bacteroidia bacterium]
STNKIASLFQIIDLFYVDTVNEQKVVDDGIRSMLKDLDPHSVYIPADELKETNEPLVGKFEGIGVQFNILQDTIMVTNTIPGGPSEKLGIMAGDRIVNINGELVAGIKIKNNDVLKKLRGDKGTKVKVDIYRRSEPNLIPFEITRDKIPLFSVDATYMATPEIGYIKISRFADTTVDEFKEALAKLKTAGMKSLILDLQGNGGGYLNRAIELADEFLPDKKMIVYTEGRAQARQENYATTTGGFEKGKVAILIDETSASASEIVSGAVQDWDRGLLIGRRSFGKRLVQKPYSLPDGSAVRLTIAHYYTPSGRCIQKSYEKGDESYDDDLSNRLKNGELYSRDSIKFNDSLKVYTNGKRVVYGGGGVMPDVFVPLDTTLNSKYWQDLRRKNVPGQWVISYIDENRKDLLAKYPTFDSFKKSFVLDETRMNHFFAFAQKQEVPYDTAGFKTSGLLIKTVLTGSLAQNLYGSVSNYYEIVNNINHSFKEAIRAINDKTFERNKVAAN